jgi:DNA-directed RNA polymerase sigma subunit (sigma70/sigma32)
MNGAMLTSRLDADTECALARRWIAQRDAAARDRLLLDNQRVVRQHTRRYRCDGCSVADLEQEGNLGLLRASLHELSTRWGITRAAVRKIERRIAGPLRRHLYREMGDAITAALGAA